MNENLVMEEDTIYEIDPVCMRQKQKREKNFKKEEKNTMSKEKNTMSKEMNIKSKEKNTMSKEMNIEPEEKNTKLEEAREIKGEECLGTKFDFKMLIIVIIFLTFR